MIEQARFDDILSKFQTIGPIIVLGDVGLDKYTHGEVNRISPEAPVPVLEVKREWMKLGLASNVSDNLQSFGVESTLCGVIGRDNNGAMFENLLEDRGIRTWGLVEEEGRMTTFKERVVTASQQICRIDYESREALQNTTMMRLNDRLDEFFVGHKCMIMEDYAKGLLSEEFTKRALAKAKERGIFVAVDPSRTTPPLWYQGANLLKPNKAEAEIMTKALGYKSTNVQDMAEVLLDKLQLEKIIITLGPEGMALVDRMTDAKLQHIPTVANEVFDVSGAGDTAISAIVAALMTGASLEEAAWVGNCASGVVVSKKGTALVSMDELRDFYKMLKQKGLR